MSSIRKRNCPECGGEMKPQLINMVYRKELSDLHIEIIGIPANVCLSCRYRIIPAEVAKYIDSLTDPLLKILSGQQEKILPTPHIGIHFPFADRTLYAD